MIHNVTTLSSHEFTVLDGGLHSKGVLAAGTRAMALKILCLLLSVVGIQERRV
jgi:hypothetical protein